LQTNNGRAYLIVFAFAMYADSALPHEVLFIEKRPMRLSPAGDLWRSCLTGRACITPLQKTLKNRTPVCMVQQIQTCHNQMGHDAQAIYRFPSPCILNAPYAKTNPVYEMSSYKVESQ